MARVGEITGRVEVALSQPLTRMAALEAARKAASRVEDVLRIADWLLAEDRSPELAAVAAVGGVEANGWAPHTVIDKDGDVWRRIYSGQYTMADWAHDDTYSISHVREAYGPLHDVSALTDRSR